jgi:hypothetical protein
MFWMIVKVGLSNILLFYFYIYFITFLLGSRLATFLYMPVYICIVVHSKLPILRSFLKDGEAECYNDITINYIPNQKPVLILYMIDNDSNNNNNNNDDDDDDRSRTEVQRIPLHEYTTKDALHELLHTTFGFTLKSKNEQDRILNVAQQQQYKERLQQHIRIEYYKWRTIYVNEFRMNIIGVVSLQEYEQQIQQQLIQQQQCRRGPVHDYLNDNYDRINLHVAGAYQSDRQLYPVQYLQKLEEKK